MVEMKELVGKSVSLLGNIPPRDVLAQGTIDEVQQSVYDVMNSVKDKSGIIWSCGGGMPQDVSTKNIKTFINAVDNF